MIQRIWVLGGDARTPFMIEKLQSMGYELTHSGMPISLATLVTAPYKKGRVFSEDALVLPVKGWSHVVHETISFTDEETLKSWSKFPIYVGSIDDMMAYYQQKYDWKVIPYNHLNPFITINSKATAQGLLAYLLTHTSELIQDQKIIIIGYGESSQAIASILAPHVAKVTVVARREEARKKAILQGLDSIDFEQIMNVISQYDCLINTVPTTVITKPILQVAKPQLQLIEIASFPGGIDRDKALENGQKVIELPGLPSIYAPQSSGYALAETLRKEFMYGN